MFRRAVATALFLSAFGAQATTYTNAGTFGGFAGATHGATTFSQGEVFTLAGSSVIEDWTYYNYYTNVPGNVNFSVFKWGGTAPSGPALYSGIILASTAVGQTGPITANMNLAVNAGSYIVTVSGFGVPNPGFIGYAVPLGNNNPLNAELYRSNNPTNSPWTKAGTSVLMYTANISPQVIAAVPEPETYAMLLAGLGVMGFVARRKRKAT